MRMVFFLLVLALLSCSSNQPSVRVAGKAEGPKDLFVMLSGDSLVLALDVKQHLQKKGYKVALNIEEGKRDVIRNDEFGNSEVLKNATFSNHRYELYLNLLLYQDRFISIQSMLRDRDKNELLGTFNWKWDRMLPAPNVEDGLEMLEKDFLKPIFD